MKVSPQALREVRDAFEQYRREVEQTDMTPSTKNTYLGRVEFFVRWLNDDFVPGKKSR